MKRIFSMIVITLFVFLPITVGAASYQEYPPYVTVKNAEKYDIEKIIDGNEVIVRLKKKGEKTYYSWSFDKNKVGDYINLDFEINLESEKKDEIDLVAGDGNITYLSFKHHGTLPSKAKITIYLGNRYSNNEKLYLYYYNEDTKKSEIIDKNVRIVDGYVEFTIDHCSEYFLTNTIVNDGTSGPKNINYVIIIMISIVVILVGATIFTDRK